MDHCRVWLRLNLPDDELARLQGEFPRCEFGRGMEAEMDPAWLAGTHVVYAAKPIPNDVLASMADLRWLQVTWSSGFKFLCPALLDRPVLVTTSRGIHAGPFSEFGLACILALAKRFPTVWANQARHTWDRPHTDDVEGKTLFIMGLGIIGTELARKAHALGMYVVATKGSPIPRPPFVDELGTPDAEAEYLRRADFVVMCLPDIAANNGYLGETALRTLKPTAYLINLSPKRGVEEPLLVRALKERWIAGAALDALPREPLPPDSELWDLPNVIISPRIAEAADPPWSLRLPIFERNLRHFLAGEPLAEAIDKARGY